MVELPGQRVSDADLHAAAQENYHFDLNAWRSLKFFFYLTATNEQGGPIGASWAVIGVVHCNTSSH